MSWMIMSWMIMSCMVMSCVIMPCVIMSCVIMPLMRFAVFMKSLPLDDVIALLINLHLTMTTFLSRFVFMIMIMFVAIMMIMCTIFMIMFGVAIIDWWFSFYLTSFNNNFNLMFMNLLVWPCFFMAMLFILVTNKTLNIFTDHFGAYIALILLNRILLSTRLSHQPMRMRSTAM